MQNSYEVKRFARSAVWRSVSVCLCMQSCALFAFGSFSRVPAGGETGENRPIKRKFKKMERRASPPPPEFSTRSIGGAWGCQAYVGYLAAKEMENWIKFKFTVKIFSLYLCHFFAVCFLLCKCVRLRRFFRLQFCFECFQDFIQPFPFDAKDDRECTSWMAVVWPTTIFKQMLYQLS